MVNSAKFELPPGINVTNLSCDRTWEAHQPSTDLIFDDGVPLESNRHRIAMNLLIHSLPQGMGDRTDYFVGGNMFVYYSQNQAMNRDFRGPDFLVALGVDSSRERKGWVVWEEGGHYPDVIVEFLSPSTEDIDRYVKKSLYQRVFRTRNYFIFDPFDPQAFKGWHLSNKTHRYRTLKPNDQGWLWCETLGLWLGTWEGVIGREPATGTCQWLRFYDADGNLVPLLEEQERQRAEQERQRAEQAEQQLQQVVINLHQAGVDWAQIAQITGLTESAVGEMV